MIITDRRMTRTRPNSSLTLILFFHQHSFQTTLKRWPNEPCHMCTTFSCSINKILFSVKNHKISSNAWFCKGTEVSSQLDHVVMKTSMRQKVVLLPAQCYAKQVTLTLGPLFCAGVPSCLSHAAAHSQYQLNVEWEWARTAFVITLFWSLPTGMRPKVRGAELH